MFKKKDKLMDTQDLLNDSEGKKKGKKKRHILRNILFCFLLIISGTAGFLVAKAQVTFDSSMSKIHRDINTSFETMELPNIKVKSENDIVNLLIIGNDERLEKGETFGGLSDVVMIATMDRKHGTLKLTSLLRDTRVFVSETGQYMKLNESMFYGGVKSLYKAIAENYNIKLDGYVEISFKAFKEVVDAVGGVEVELTDTEVRYLSVSNYIRDKKKYRKNLKVGKQTLTGSQALGYCRIRKGYDLIGEPVVTPNGLMDDYGRTWRQRTLLTAVFNKMKTRSMSTWLDVANKALKYLKTDLSDEKIMEYMKGVITMGTTEVHQQQIPINGYFRTTEVGEAADVGYGEDRNVRDGVYKTSYVVPTNGQSSSWDIAPSRDAFHQFVFEYDGKGEFEYKPSGSGEGDETGTD